MSFRLPENLPVTHHVRGSVNTHEFEFDGEGGGNPYSGKIYMKLLKRGGEPLTFSIDIMTSAFEYGFHAFTKYPDDIEDYYKGSFPHGFTWDRKIEFEDGGVINMTNDIKLVDGRLFGNCWITGVNFPKDGPVMTNRIEMEEAAQETMVPSKDGMIGYCSKPYRLRDGSYYHGFMTTYYRSKKPNHQPAGFHFINRRLLKIKVDPGCKCVEQVEFSEAFNCTLPHA